MAAITSPLDRIDSTQFSLDEIRAAVAEAEAQDRYVMTHAYTPNAINRALECGVRSIEHGSMLDQATAEHIVRRNAFLVPTIVVLRAMEKHGDSIRLSHLSRTKAAEVEKSAMHALEITMRAGVRMAFGSDLSGEMLSCQSEEFGIRCEIQKPIDVIRSATVHAAELFNLNGRIGVIAPGAYADLLVVDGDPVADINLLQQQGKHLAAIMKGGTFVVNRL